jgi:hypothetical protein
MFVRAFASCACLLLSGGCWYYAEKEPPPPAGPAGPDVFQTTMCIPNENTGDDDDIERSEGCTMVSGTFMSFPRKQPPARPTPTPDAGDAGRP